MNISKLIYTSVLAAMATMTIQAGNIDATAAQAAANSFLKHRIAAGTINAPALADVRLAHAEASSVVTGANDYYAFNIKGGGFVIIAGEDRAVQVLGYSDKGHFDANNLPAPLQDLLSGYKREIEFLQTYKGDDLVASTTAPTFKDAGTVGPLIKSTWGQEMPYYLQCPLYQGEYCVVGCIATAMAQVMNYWQYPTTMSSISRYYCSDIGAYVPALPATTIDYSLILDSYCHWDWDNSQLIQDTYTDAQAQEVAKLGRYCGQAVKMGYSPDGSGAYTYNQHSAMINFGYSNAEDVSKSGNWYGGGSSYTTAQWEAMLKSDLDAGRPILYSASDPNPNGGGHAFICDGYNSDGYFHFNLGWYGTCDGWYTTTSLKMLHRDGTNLNFSSSHEIVYKLEPPTYCNINAASISADNSLLVLGEDLAAVAGNVTLNTSYSNVNMVFALTDDAGSRIATGNGVNVAKSTFTQGSDINGTLTLPETLSPGEYNLQLNYYTTSASALTAVATAEGQLVVVGRVAKYNGRFDVADVSKVINYILRGHDGGVALDVADVSMLIDYILGK